MDDDADMDASYPSVEDDVRRNEPFNFANECPQASGLQALAHVANADDLWNELHNERGDQNDKNRM